MSDEIRDLKEFSTNIIDIYEELRFEMQHHVYRTLQDQAAVNKMMRKHSSKMDAENHRYKALLESKANAKD